MFFFFFYKKKKRERGFRGFLMPKRAHYYQKRVWGGGEGVGYFIDV